MGVAIVTAGDSGIGKATCVALGEVGFDVGLTYRSDEEGAQDTARQVRDAGRRADVRRHDLADPPAAAAVVDELADVLGGLDDRVFLVAGPPAMAEGVSQALVSAGVPEERVRADGFSGY